MNFFFICWWKHPKTIIARGEMHMSSANHGKVLFLLKLAPLQPHCKMKQLEKPNLIKWDQQQPHCQGVNVIN
jgi:hypothetical protein